MLRKHPGQTARWRHPTRMCRAQWTGAVAVRRGLTRRRSAGRAGSSSRPTRHPVRSGPIPRLRRAGRAGPACPPRSAWRSPPAACLCSAAASPSRPASPACRRDRSRGVSDRPTNRTVEVAAVAHRPWWSCRGVHSTLCGKTSTHLSVIDHLTESSPRRFERTDKTHDTVAAAATHAVLCVRAAARCL